jgi:hypothetical protein
LQFSIRNLVFKEHLLNSALRLLIHCVNHCLKLFLTPCNKAQIFSFTPIMGTFGSWLQWKWVFGDILRGSIWYCQVQQICWPRHIAKFWHLAWKYLLIECYILLCSLGHFTIHCSSCTSFFDKMSYFVMQSDSCMIFFLWKPCHCADY